MKNNLKLFLAGALMDLALAPFYLFPVLFFSFPYLYNSIKAAENSKQAFWRGWWFGFGYFVFGLYWIANSLLVDLRFAWLIPFAISLIPAAAGLFIGVAMMFARGKSPIIFAIFWVAAEYAKGIFPFGGFPWNNIGYSSLFSIYFAQIAALGGIYFVSLIVVLTALIPAYKRKLPMLIIPVLCFGYGFVHVQETKFTNKTATIIQPNIAQNLKWDATRTKTNFFDTLELSAKSKSDFTIWPESSVPYPIENNPEVLNLIAKNTNKYAIVSSTRMQGDYEKIWNTLYVTDSSAKILDYYDKHHLVPFGEYVPLRKYLPIDKITPGMLDFSAGNSGKVLQIADSKILPLICYEIIFPQYAFGDYDFMVNITNDAWFGNSTGPRQHLAMVQMRAIEQGRPILRAANTGISAVVDANGRILQSLTYNNKGEIVTNIPDKIDTLYSTMSNL